MAGSGDALLLLTGPSSLSPMLFLDLFRYFSCVLKDYCVCLVVFFFLKSLYLGPTVCVCACV